MKDFYGFLNLFLHNQVCISMEEDIVSISETLPNSAKAFHLGI